MDDQMMAAAARSLLGDLGKLMTYSEVVTLRDKLREEDPSRLGTLTHHFLDALNGDGDSHRILPEGWIPR